MFKVVSQDSDFVDYTISNCETFLDALDAMGVYLYLAHVAGSQIGTSDRVEGGFYLGAGHNFFEWVRIVEIDTSRTM